MYSEIHDKIESYLESNIPGIESGYLGEFPQIDLRKNHILIEPRFDDREPHSTRWNRGVYRIRLWIMVAFDISYKKSMNEIEDLLSELQTSLTKLKVDDSFVGMSGVTSGKEWRISDRGLNSTKTTFGVMQRNETKVNTAQIDLEIYLDVER